MKYTLTMVLFLSINAFASIEHDPNQNSKVTESELNKNRACFMELETQGCQDPGEDAQQFRSCMSNVYPSLSKDCKLLMTKLYGKR